MNIGKSLLKTKIMSECNYETHIIAENKKIIDIFDRKSDTETLFLVKEPNCHLNNVTANTVSPK